MRRAARVDANQGEIVKALRKIGASVQPLHMVGEGCPDALVGYRGKNYVMEIKDGTRKPSEQRLTPDESNWHVGWMGQVHVVKSIDDALRVVTS